MNSQLLTVYLAYLTCSSSSSSLLTPKQVLYVCLKFKPLYSTTVRVVKICMWYVCMCTESVAYCKHHGCHSPCRSIV